VLDIKRSQEPGIKEEPWQTDTCVGDWFYHVKTVYKRPDHVIEILIDIIAKNGNLLLNFPQRPDGTIDEECRYILQEMARWMAVCSEGVYGTRPFRVSGEGSSSVVIDHFKEDKVDCSASDFRFTQKGNTVYAFQMKAPDDHLAVICSLGPEDRVKRVRLLGAGDVEFRQAWGALVVSLPEQLPTPYAHCLAIELEG